MTPEKIAGLRATRARIEAALRVLQPPADPAAPHAARRADKARARELRDLQGFVAKLDRLLAGVDGEPSVAGRRKLRASRGPLPRDELGLLVGCIPRGNRGDAVLVRVLAEEGRRAIDVRLFLPKGDGMVPTRSGVRLDAEAVAPLLEALRIAAQHA